MFKFKICNSCMPRYQKAIGVKKRVCPTCGIKGVGAFRCPTEQEMTAFSAENEKRKAFLEELLMEAS